VDYSLDTSALLDGWVRYYPRDVFPKFWTGIEGLIAQGKRAAIEEVLRELEKKDDEVHGWAKLQSGLFVPVDGEIQGAVKSVVGRYPGLVNAKRSRSTADPFVIALAIVQECAVVTGERPNGIGSKKPRIPDVCLGLGVRCLTMVDVFREQGWTA
jgi:hypothetical protein